MTLVSLEGNGFGPQRHPSWEGVGRRRKRSAVFSEGSSRKRQGCLPSVFIYLAAVGEARCGNDQDQGPAQGKGGVGAKPGP